MCSTLCYVQRKDLGVFVCQFVFEPCPSSASAHLEKFRVLDGRVILIPLYLDRLTFQEKLDLLEAVLAPSGSCLKISRVRGECELGRLTVHVCCVCDDGRVPEPHSHSIINLALSPPFLTISHHHCIGEDNGSLHRKRQSKDTHT